MQKKAAAIALCLFLSAGPSLAQTAGDGRKPGPGHKKLEYFVGNWKSEGETKENPFMPAGKFSSNDLCAWFEGNFAVICRYDGKGTAGPTKGLGILGYNEAEKVYTYYGLDNTPMIMMSVPKGTVADGVWTYDDETTMGGTTMKSRYIIKELSPDSYSFKWEMLGEDGAWQTIVEGKSKRAS